MGLLNQWWVWLIIIFIILFAVWAWCRFKGEPLSDTQDISSSSSSSKEDVTASLNSLNSKRVTSRVIADRALTKKEKQVQSRDRNNARLYSSEPIITSLSSTETRRVSTYKTKLSTEMIVRLDSLEQERDESVRKHQSKGEAECLRVLEKIRGKRARVQVRDLDVLKNRVTGRNLELDIYFPDDVDIGGCKHLACEYHGRQHYRYTPFFHRGGIEDFEYQRWKDNEKVDMCDRAGIYLITVPNTIPIKKIEDFIIYSLPENVYERQKEDARRMFR